MPTKKAKFDMKKESAALIYLSCSTKSTREYGSEDQIEKIGQNKTETSEPRGPTLTSNGQEKI
jgi:hypothetical protein